MEIIVAKAEQGLGLIGLCGRLDAAGVQAGEAEFNTILAGMPDVIIDLAQVSFIASVGIRLLVAGAQAHAKVGGRMVMVRPDEMTRRILRTTGVDQVIRVFDDMTSAVAAFD